MSRIYFAAVEEKAGKTSLILGLAGLLEGSVGYLKPVGRANAYRSGRPFDRDGEVAAEALGLGNPEALVPLISTDYLRYWRPPEDAWDRILGAVRNDVNWLLLEGREWFGRGLFSGLSDGEIARRLDAALVLVGQYEGEASVDRVLRAAGLAGETLCGVIFNAVSVETELPEVRGTVAPALEDRGIPVLGIIPFERKLRVVTMAEVAEALGGEVLVEGDLGAEVERFLVGAMSEDAALRYLRRIPGKLAVVTGGDRADIQSAALSCERVRGLILTGSLRPERSILARAAEREVPVVLVPQDTMTAAETAEGLVGRAPVRGKHLETLRELVRESVDVERLEELTARR
ncbi:DRTGG domain-containing protein [Candidatus Bipolaricaulota sp. J31]